MKYFIDDSRKVALFDVNPTIDKKTAWGYDANGEVFIYNRYFIDVAVSNLGLSDTSIDHITTC